MILNCLQYKCFVLNSLGPKNARHDKIWNGLKWLLAKEYTFQSSALVTMSQAMTYVTQLWQLQDLGISVPQQIGSKNCGMFLIENCDYIMDDLSPCFTFKQMKYFRGKKLLELLKGQLIDL